MTTIPLIPMPQYADSGTLLARALETERAYFELGAEIRRLPGAMLAWMPGLSASPAASVVHRIDPRAIDDEWTETVEQALVAIGATMARLYLDNRYPAADERLRGAGYFDREELIFAHSLAEPTPGMILRPVTSDADWERKRRFHEAVGSFPDGHRNRASDWVALERRKCAEGMDAFLAESGGEIVGAVGAIWGEDLLRIKNLVVHPSHRRRSIGLALIAHVAAVGRQRGIFEQCVLALKGEAGELLYSAAGMRLIGSQIEWSKQLGGSAE